MLFAREIGMPTGEFIIDPTSVAFKIIIIYVTFSTTVAAPIVVYPNPKKRQYSNYFLKNRQNIGRAIENKNDATEYDGPLIYRDYYLNDYKKENSRTRNFAEVKSRSAYSRMNRMSSPNGIRRSFDRADGMTRILTFPLKNSDGGMVRGFEPGDPAGDCLTGGLDAGVVNGALKIGIGVGLAPGCGTSTEQPPKLVPVFVPRPVPVPVGVPQPYPVTIDRPVAIRVPQPIPFPSLNMGPPPMMGPMSSFPGRMMIGSRGW